MEEHKKMNFFKKVYENHYKILLFCSLFIVLLSIGQIAYQTMTTGDFINKGVSLKGGVTVTLNRQVDSEAIESYLNDRFSGADLSVRSISSAQQSGVIIEASDIEANELVDALDEKYNLKKDEYNVEIMGGSLGASFFQETLRIILIAFVFMGIVVFYFFGPSWKTKLLIFLIGIINITLIYFSNSWIMYLISAMFGGILLYICLKYSLPSFGVILCAFSDIVTTIALVNLIGIKVSTAGIAAILMLIGYSVDTDILLSTKVLKRKSGSVIEAIYKAMSTGIMMTTTTLIAVIAGLILGHSDVLKQMMTILLCGLVADLPFTWIQNAGILRWHLEKKERKHHE